MRGTTSCADPVAVAVRIWIARDIPNTDADPVADFDSVSDGDADTNTNTDADPD